MVLSFEAILPHFLGALVALTSVLCFIQSRLSVYRILAILLGVNRGLPWAAKHKTWKPSQVPFLSSKWPLFPSVTSAYLGCSLVPSSSCFFILPSIYTCFYGTVGLIRTTLPLPEPRPWGAYIKMMCQNATPREYWLSRLSLGWGPRTYVVRSVAYATTLRNTFSQHSESFSLCSNTSPHTDSFLFIMQVLRKI